MFSPHRSDILISRSETLVSSASTLPVLETVEERLLSCARLRPSAPLISQSQGGRWCTCSYGEAEQKSASLSQALLERGLRYDRPLMIAAPASIDHGLLRIAALRARVPYIALSPALFLHKAGDRLKALRDIAQPGLIVLSGDCVDAYRNSSWLGSTPSILLESSEFAAMKSGSSLPDMQKTVAGKRLDDLAAVFLTSGSTGVPKMVTVTQRMISANQAGYATLWPWLQTEDLVMLDWLPWHHTFGGNDNFHKAIWHGGHYVIDDGRPDTDEGLSRMAQNIRDIRPTFHINVPKGIEGLLELLENDASFFDQFFARMRVVFFAGAGMSDALWRGLRGTVAKASKQAGREIALVTGYGSTETGSTVCLVHFPIDRPDIIGLPLPGLELKLVPHGDKQELRVKGPTVTPGYWKAPDATAAAFDEEGFFRTGDAVKIVDSPAGPVLSFDGRLGEDFKLANGSWVSVGPLRLRLLAVLAQGGVAASDLLICSDGDRLGIILVIPGGYDPARLAEVLQEHNRNNPAATTFISRAVGDARPLSFAAGEVSEKGHPNMRTALAKRAAIIERLFAQVPDAEVLCFERAGRT